MQVYSFVILLLNILKALFRALVFVFVKFVYPGLNLSHIVLVILSLLYISQWYSLVNKRLIPAFSELCGLLSWRLECLFLLPYILFHYYLQLLRWLHSFFFNLCPFPQHFDPFYFLPFTEDFGFTVWNRVLSGSSLLSNVIKSTGFGIPPSKFKSNLCNLLAVWFWASYLTSLDFDFLICKMRAMLPTS